MKSWRNHAREECKRKLKQLNNSKVHKSKLKLQYAKEICSNDPSLTHSNLNESHHDESNFPRSSEIRYSMKIYPYINLFLSEKKTFIETKQINNLIYNFPDIPEKRLCHHIKKIYCIY